MKILCRTLPVWALIACLPPMVHAQTPRGTLTGTVIDSANQPISGVIVFIDGGITNPVLTGAVGAFRVEVVTPGTHVLNFRKAGFTPRTFRLPATRNDGDRTDVGVIRLEQGPDPTGTVAGTVTDAVTGRGVRSALVKINDVVVAVSGADGAFRAFQVPLEWGPNQFEVNHLSYGEVINDLWFVNPEDAFAFDVTLVPVPVAVVPEIVVEVDRTLMVYGRMRQFYQRRASGLGFFFTRREIEERNPTQMTDVFNGLPGVQLQAFGLTRVAVTFTRAARFLSNPCDSPDLYVDGALVAGGFFLNDLLSPEQVEGIELYRGTSETPLQFQKPGSTCGAIVLWTR